MASKFPGDEIKGEVTCVICYELYKQPLLLPCGHTFCRDCLKTLLPPRPPLQVRCPRCHRLLTLKEGLDELLKNTAIANIVSSMQRLEKPSNKAAPDAEMRLRMARGCLDTRLAIVADKQVKLVETMLSIQSESVAKKNQIAAFVRQLCEELGRKKTSLQSQVDSCLARAMADCRAQQEALEARSQGLLQLAKVIDDLLKKALGGDSSITEQQLTSITTRVEQAGSDDPQWEKNLVTPKQLTLPELDLSKLNLKMGEKESEGCGCPTKIPDAVSTSNPLKTSPRSAGNVPRGSPDKAQAGKNKLSPTRSSPLGAHLKVSQVTLRQMSDIFESTVNPSENRSQNSHDPNSEAIESCKRMTSVPPPNSRQTPPKTHQCSHRSCTACTEGDYRCPNYPSPTKKTPRSSRSPRNQSTQPTSPRSNAYHRSNSLTPRSAGVTTPRSLRSPRPTPDSSFIGPGNFSFHAARCSVAWKTAMSRALEDSSNDMSRPVPMSRVGPVRQESFVTSIRSIQQQQQRLQRQQDSRRQDLMQPSLATQLFGGRRLDSPRGGLSVIRTEVKHYNRFLLLEVEWSPYPGAHHYRVTTLGPGVPRVMDQVVDREEICLMCIFTTSVIIHHALFGSRYTLVVQAMSHDGTCLAMSEPVHVKTPRMVLFEDVQFDPMGCHPDIAVDDEMHGIYHRKNQHLGKEEWENFSLLENSGAGACYPFMQPALDFELVFFECKVTMTVLKPATNSEKGVLCSVGLCKENYIDLTPSLFKNPKSQCCNFTYRADGIDVSFWDGWVNQVLKGEETAKLKTQTDKKTVVTKLGFFVNLCKGEFFIVDEEQSVVLQEFALPAGHHQWLPVASLYRPDLASSVVNWIRPERLPDCIVSRLIATP